MKFKFNGSWFIFVIVSIGFGILHCFGLITFGITSILTIPLHIFWAIKFTIENTEGLK